ncbi:MAG: hypothetical protein Tsb0019_26930 [Roseibium sp.]
MHISRKVITALIAAGIASGAAAGTAFADFPDQAYGDLNGSEPVSVRQQQIANQKILGSAGGATPVRHGTAIVADFPDQAYGDLNGSVPVSVRELSRARASTGGLNLKFLGDWNGTAKSGFPRQ